MRQRETRLTLFRLLKKDLIDQLKKSAKNPTWYVHAVWVEKTYGPRLDDKPAKDDARSTDAAAGDRSETSQPATEPQVVALLQQRISQLQQDKQDLREEMKIENDQINQANERDRETHHLMRDLHELLRDMQQRLPAPSSQPLPVPTAENDQRPAEIDATPSAASVPPAESPTTVITEKGSRSAPKKRRSPGTSRKRKSTSARKPKKRTTKKKPTSIFQKHTPTLHKAASPFLSTPMNPNRSVSVGTISPQNRSILDMFSRLAVRFLDRTPGRISFRAGTRFFAL